MFQSSLRAHKVYISFKKIIITFPEKLQISTVINLRIVGISDYDKKKEALFYLFIYFFFTT